MFNINFANDWIRTADFGIVSDRSTNWATTTSTAYLYFEKRSIF